MAVPLEKVESEFLANRLDRNGYLFSAIRNESDARSFYKGKQRKKSGVRKGIPDFCIKLHNNSMCFIELKVQKEIKKNGKGFKKVKNDASIEQLHWIKELSQCDNVNATVCYGYKEATDFILHLEAS